MLNVSKDRLMKNVQSFDSVPKFSFRESISAQLGFRYKDKDSILTT